MNINQLINAGQALEFTEVGDFFRLMDAPDPITVIFYLAGKEVGRAVDVREGYAELFDKGGFDRVRVASGTTQTVQFVTRQGTRVFYDTPPVGDVNVLNPLQIAPGQSLALVQATIDALRRPIAYGAAFDSATTLGAGATEQVFSAASNVNGAIVHAASLAGHNAGSVVSQSSLIAHTVAPASFLVGDVLMQVELMATIAGAAFYAAKLNREVFVPAGKGVWFYNQIAESAGARRALYTLL